MAAPLVLRAAARRAAGGAARALPRRAAAGLDGARWIHASRALLGRIPFKLADIGEGIAEVEVLQWFVKPGDNVQQFQKIVEVQSDKATVEITSRYDGVVQSLNWKVGEMAKVGSTLVELEVEGKEGDSAGGKGKEVAAAAAAPAPAPAPAGAAPPKAAAASSAGAAGTAAVARPAVQLVKPAEVLKQLGSFSVEPVLTGPGVEPLERPAAFGVDSDKLLTTPAVRRLARDHDIDLALVPASGKDGRVLKEDLLNYIKNVPLAERKATQAQYRARAAAAPAEPEPAAGVAVKAPAAAAAEAAAAAAAAGAPAAGGKGKLVADQVVPVKGIARIMVKSMEESLKIPHFLFKEEYDMSQMVEFRAQLKAGAEKRGIKLSYMPILIKATSLSLTQFPGLNALFSSAAMEVTHKASHNIGVAMDTPRGLLVPVIRDCQQLSILDIARELGRLQELGAANKLGEKELTGGTFTLSNIGAIGGTYAAPIIPAPTLCIGAIGRIQTVPRFRDAAAKEPKDVFAARVMNISWAADHRVVDGATVARFSNQLKAYIESPLSMVSDMN